VVCNGVLREETIGWRSVRSGKVIQEKGGKEIKV
jgi:hypothetical protein